MLHIRLALGRAVRISNLSVSARSAPVTKSLRLTYPVGVSRRLLSDEAGYREPTVPASEPAPPLEDSNHTRTPNPARRSTFQSRSDEPVEPSHSLYVGNLFFDVTAEDLKNEFSKCGTVEFARVICDVRGISRGYGYVKFPDVESAQKAMTLMNGQLFEGRRLVLNFARNDNFVSDRPTKLPTRTLFIGNMSYEMTNRDLDNLFKDVHNVIDVRVAVDRRTGQTRGFAHADFVDVESAQKAYELLKKKAPFGRPLRVDYSHSSKFKDSRSTVDRPGLGADGSIAPDS